jgi:hypothetical protein
MMGPALRPCPISSVALAYLSNTQPLDHSIRRRYILQFIGFPCDTRSSVQIGMRFLTMYTAKYLITTKIFSSARGSSLGALSVLYQSVLGLCTRLLSASVFGLLIVRDGGLLFRRIAPYQRSYCMGWISFFIYLILLFWLHNLVFHSFFAVSNNQMIPTCSKISPTIPVMV